jgi:arylsulfatase A-like enzyme
MTTSPSAPFAAGRRPNVVFILSDDQGPWAAGCYGNAEIRTPNLDRLAAEGVRLTHFFVATPVCSPSRATLLTGTIPSQHGIHDWLYAGPSTPDRPDYNVGPDARPLLAGQVAYTDVMAAHGYRCGLSGKWHLGDSLRPQHSFDFWFVHQRGGGPYNDAPMVRDGRLTTEPGYVTDVITDEALRFLDRHYAARPDQPFYLGVHYTAPHSPWTGHPQALVDSYADCPFASCPQEPRHPWAGDLTDRCLGNREMLQGYFAAVTAMDANIGRLLARLDALGIRQDTLVVFTSDNGFSCGHHGFWGKGNGTHPRNMYEHSIRVPCIFSHPGRLPQGHVAGAMASAYDFMPTLLEYLDLPIPADRNLPGASFLPDLRAAGRPILRQAQDRLDDRRPTRGDRPVVVYDEYGPVRMIRTREWKYVYRHPDGPHDLYDLVSDPDERRNLADDPGQVHRIRDLHAQLEAWFARYVVPERDGLRARLDVGAGAW